MRAFVRLAALLAVMGLASRARAQNLPISTYEINDVTGDSITGGTFPWWRQYIGDISHRANGVAVTHVAVGLGATHSSAGVGVTHTSVAMAGKTYSSTTIAFSNSGLNIAQIRGQQNSWLTAGVSAGATTYYIEAGTNNISGANKDVAGAQAASIGIIADIHAAAPSAKIAWVDLLSAESEQVPYAPTDADLTTVRGYIMAAVAACPSYCYFLSIRPAQQAYEVANNTPSPGVSSGVLTLDGTHPNFRGQAFYWTTILPQISFQ